VVKKLVETPCYKQKVVDSSPDEVIELFFFNLPNPSSRTMILGLTQPLTEISTRKCFWGVERDRNLTAICEPIIYAVWDPQHFTTLQTCTACYRESFTYFYLIDLNRMWYDRLKLCGVALALFRIINFNGHLI
jgi:hypothetical protein